MTIFIVMNVLAHHKLVQYVPKEEVPLLMIAQFVFVMMEHMMIAEPVENVLTNV